MFCRTIIFNHYIAVYLILFINIDLSIFLYSQVSEHEWIFPNVLVIQKIAMPISVREDIVSEVGRLTC